MTKFQKANYDYYNDTIEFNIDGIVATAKNVDDDEVGRILWFNRGSYRFEFEDSRFEAELVGIEGGEPELRVMIDGIERGFFCNDELISVIFEELMNEIDDYGTYDEE